MSSIKWIKITTSIFDDEKIKLIDALPERDTIFYVWVRLLVLAGKTNDDGLIYLSDNIPYTDEMYAAIFNRPLNVIRLALDTFLKFGMIEVTDKKHILISNWDKHQNVDEMNKIREQTRKRVAEHREKKKLLQGSAKEESCSVSNEESNATCNVTETLRNGIDIDIDIELDKDIDIKKKNKIIIPYDEIFELYNQQNVTKHKSLTDKMKAAIKAAITKNSIDNVKTAIIRYGTMYHDNSNPYSKSYCNYKWTLEEFLTRSNAMPEFLDEGGKWIRYNEGANSYGNNEYSGNGKQIKDDGINWEKLGGTEF